MDDTLQDPQRHSGIVHAEVERLHRARPRNGFQRLSAFLALALLGYSLFATGLFSGRLLRPAAVQQWFAFLSAEAVPFPMRAAGSSSAELWAWVRELFVTRAGSGALHTLCIAAVSLVLATAIAFVLAPFGAANVVTARPFDTPATRQSGRTRNSSFAVVRSAARILFVFARAVPEYLWAFLFLAVLGPGAWPAILAIALHNAGILGRLGAETIENLPAAAPRALTSLGASRVQVLLFAALPITFNRSLLYFFERFETTLREATVLGLLGIVSLGYFIEEARNKLFYDELIFFTLTGMLLILATDLCSWMVRSRLRR